MTLAKYTPEQWEIKQQEKRDKESQNVVTAIKTPRFMKIKRLVKTALLVIALNGPTKTVASLEAETANDLTDILEEDLVVS